MKTIDEQFQEDAQNLVSRVNEIEPRLNASFDDGFIIGSFRAKRGTGFKYSIHSKTFVYNGAGAYAFDAINKAIQEIKVIGVSK